MSFKYLNLELVENRMKIWAVKYIFKSIRHFTSFGIHIIFQNVIIPANMLELRALKLHVEVYHILCNERLHKTFNRFS